jgi:transcriptional regulator with XRE-family HTH domain
MERLAVVNRLRLVRRPSSALGAIIRQQRRLHQLTLRQFAAMAGISNPYLSQIERGLREPSESVVDSIARSLEMSVDTLYEQAGLERDGAGDGRAAVEAALEADSSLSPRQRRVLMEVYDSMVAAGTQPRRRPHARRRRDG